MFRPIFHTLFFEREFIVKPCATIDEAWSKKNNRGEGPIGVEYPVETDGSVVWQFFPKPNPGSKIRPDESEYL